MKTEKILEPDFDELRALVDEYIDALSIHERYKDIEAYVFEAAIEAFYGKDVWGWVNQKIDEMDELGVPEP